LKVQKENDEGEKVAWEARGENRLRGLDLEPVRYCQKRIEAREESYFHIWKKLKHNWKW